MKISKLLLLLASAAALCAGSVSANPVLRLSTSQGFTQTVADGDPGPSGDINPLAGAITFSGPLGAWFLNVTTGLGSAIYGGQPHLDLNSVNVSSFGTGGAPSSGSITLELSEQNLTLGSAAQLVNFLGQIGGTTAGNVTWSLFVDDGNALFGTSTLIGTGVSGGSPFAGSASALAAIEDTFSMTLRVVINHADGIRTTSFDFEAFVVPEPGTLLLLGMGTLALAFYRRRPQA